MNEHGTHDNGRSFDSSLPNYISINGAQSAWELLLEEDHCSRITTSCAEFDHILGGGVACKEVTEVGGVPGIGKTQLGIQLAVNVQIPVICGGVGGKAVYIDTEGSFMVERALQISEGCIEDVSKNKCLRRKDAHHYEVGLHPKDILEGIFYFRIYNYIQQVAVINYLDEFISEHLDVKIVIIDSIAFHFRQETDDMAHRARVLSGMASKLMKLSNKFCLAVVAMNQVTTKYSNGSFHLALALGDTWSHASTNRVILYWEEDERRAYLDKSPSLPPTSAPFSVTTKGIRTSFSSKRLKTTSS